MRRLQSQTICGRMEIVLVTPVAHAHEADAALLAGFSSWKAVIVPEVASMSEARAAGVAAASGRYIVFTEDHCFPEREWAEAIVDAFEHHGADVVGPVFLNANPQFALSWSIFLQEYADWMAPHPGGLMHHLPGHNGAYRREQLLALGANLKGAIEAESALHFEWHAQGLRLWLEPRARVHHVNVTDTWAALTSTCAFQRLWANSRAQSWSWARRLAYALGSPLIPFVRLVRIAGALRRTGRAREMLLRTLPWSIVTLSAGALGECLGYMGSTGNAEARLVEVELYRREYLRDAAVEGVWDDPPTARGLQKSART